MNTIFKPGDSLDEFEIEAILDADPWKTRALASGDGERVELLIVHGPDEIDDASYHVLSEVQTEMMCFARVSHPCLNPLHEVRVARPARLVAVLDPVVGQPLATLRQDGTWQSPTVAIRGAELLARALHGLHTAADAQIGALGLVVRDLNPTRIFAGHDERWVLGAPFPLTRLFTGSGVNSQREAMRYMAPEQIKAEALDGRADIYSLGVILYEELHRGLVIPGSGSMLDELKAAMDMTLTPLDQLGPELEPVRPVLAGLFIKDRDARAYQTGEAFADALAAARDELGSGEQGQAAGASPAGEERDRLLDKWRPE